MNVPFDPGLQVERTLLAWRRTCLSVGAGSAALVRLSVGELGASVVVAGVCGVALAAWAYAMAPMGYRRAHAELTSTGTKPPSGAALALMTAALLLLGLVCAGYVLSGG